MLISLERFILGGTIVLLILFSIFLLLLKSSILQSRTFHRLLGASGVVLSLALIYMYLEVESVDKSILHGLRIVITLACIGVYSLIIGNVVKAIISYIRIPADETPLEMDIDESPEVADEEDDTDATDEEGNPIPQPSEDNMEDIIFFQKLEAIMATQRLFSNPDITREQVAMEVGTNRTYLIRSIKLATGKTFSEYLTDLRVNYAATLLTTTDQPLDYIGTLAGFRSKSVYYRAFAAANNCTPSEYRNREQIQNRPHTSHADISR